ncbi:MAG: Rho-binding antiterminator [Gammaproteobacteria bacterium]|jgi:Rho-binding antiterminator
MIGCAQYDNIDLACLFHYRIRLTLNSDQVIEGVALDTGWDSNHQECIKSKNPRSKNVVLIPPWKGVIKLTF